MENLKTILKKEETKIIDVREAWKYETGHISNAINIPLTEIPVHLDELKKMNGPIILYCQSGKKCGMAVNLLIKSGLKDVYNPGSFSDIQQLIMN